MSGLKRFGNYFLLKKIATGGMAELYKAKKSGEKGFEKLLAIKLILPHLASNEEFTSMFVDEAKVAALLNHQNIVQIYDLGRIEDTYCIVMEYVRGRDLRSVISRAIKLRAPIKMEHACLITANVLAGLGYAHRLRDKGKDLNIVHRDISPQNILISYEGEVKIVDFGIAKAATQSRDTQAGVLKGKLAYMSPEQAQGRQLDMRSDIFSAGVVLYELLTGRKLFQGDTDMATLEMVRAARVEPLPSRLSKSFPLELEAILLKALAKEPDKRYQNAADMEGALLDFMRARGYSTSGYSLSGYMYSLFKDEIEKDIKEEQELDQTAVTDTRGIVTVAGDDGTTLPRPEGAPVKTGQKPAPKTSAPRVARPAVPAGRDATKSGRGGLFIAVAVLAILALGVAWIGMKAMQKRRAAMHPATPVEEQQEAAPSAPAEEPSPVVQQETSAAGPAPAEEAPAPAVVPEVGPAPRAVQPAEAVINSEPTGAKAYVDGRPVGATPVKVPGIKPNVAHTVRLELDGYEDWSGAFKAGSGGSEVVSAMMKEIVFSLDVSTKPPGARVLLDGWDTGRKTPTTLEALKPRKTYTVRLELNGYEPYEEHVSSDGAGRKSITAELVQLFGELTINTRPWAFVFVDGEKIGMTPLAGVRLPAGEHEVTLANPKQELRKRLKVVIKPDETTRIVIDLGGRKP